MLVVGAGRGFAERARVGEKNCGEQAGAGQNPRCKRNGDTQRACHEGKSEKDEGGAGEDNQGRDGYGERPGLRRLGGFGDLRSWGGFGGHIRQLSPGWGSVNEIV